MKMKLPQYIENEQVERVRSRLKSVKPTRTIREKVLEGFEREIMRLHDSGSTLNEIADIINADMKITTAREVGRVVARCVKRRKDAEAKKAAKMEAAAAEVPAVDVASGTVDDV